MSIASIRTAAEIHAEQRAAYFTRRRALFGLLEAHPLVIPLPSYDSGSEITFQFLHGSDPRAAMAAAARVIPCDWRKKTWEGESATYFELDGEWNGLTLRLVAFREAVCERVVTGTEDREVEEVVEPAKTRTVVKPVETVEWRCRPVLAPAAQPESLVSA